MKTSFPRALLALLALTFVVVACAGETGSQWTFAPLTANQTEVEMAAAEEPAEATEGEPATEPSDEGAAAAGDARVIELLADAALRFTDLEGQVVSEIPVTPGETVLFRIDNTSNFDHNFYIGTDEELSPPNATTDVGIPTWQSGVEELEWTVPDDISGLKFGCTIPGHYLLMQGVFTLDESAPAPEEPAAEEPAAEEPAAEEPVAEEPVAEEPAAEGHAATEPAAEGHAAASAADGESRVIELEADAAIRFLQDGEQITQIPVTPGETVVFRIDNTANFAHNFWIGPDDVLQAPNGETDIGVPDWNSGVQEFEWTVPEDVSDLRFACTVPGHYFTMQGDFVISE